MIGRKVVFLHLFLILTLLPGFFSAYAANWGSIFVDYPFSNFFSSTGEYSSIAIDSADKVHIIYRDESGKLKYATNLSEQWKITTFASWGNIGYVTSMAIDSFDKIHISFSDSTNRDLKYATNISGTWTTTTVDSLGAVGSTSSITIDSADRIHISYSDGTNGNLKYARKDNGGWNISTLDDTGLTGLSSSIVTDPQNNVHISYVESKTIFNNYQGQYNYHLKYITNKSGEWVATTVYFPSELGEFTFERPIIDTSIAVDKENSAHIAYFQPELKDLIYASNSSGSWVVTTLAESGDTGFYPSISIDSSNKVHISYHDKTNGSLRYISNFSGVWRGDIVDASGTSGINSSIALDSFGAVHISYAHSNNQSCFDCGGSHFLKYANNITPTHQIGAGTWFYATTGNWLAGHPRCLAENDEKATATLVRDGNNIFLILADGLVLTGMIDHAQLDLSASFSEHPVPDRYLPEPNVTYLADGLMTVIVNLTASSSISLSGTVSWSWVFDENIRCNGGSNISVSAINVEVPEQNNNSLSWMMLLLNQE